MAQIRAARILVPAMLVAGAAVLAARSEPRQSQALPDGPLVFGRLRASFGPDGALTLGGSGWPTLDGRWTRESDTLVLTAERPPRGCEGPGRYRPAVEGRHVRLALVTDDCEERRMMLDRSDWRPADEPPPVVERRITRTVADGLPPLPGATPADGAWPRFRGPGANGVADGQHLPDEWDGPSGRNVLWRAAVPGLAHSSPVVWGDRVFVTTAISSRPDATFKPGLYGAGDASDDRTPQRWVVMAFDAATGKRIWERTAVEGEPKQKRHVKSTYASATPATDGRLVVASFGSQGVFAYDVDGRLRWSVDLGRLDLGAYDIPSFEWGTASSPTIWEDLVFLQCDTQQDSFVVALDLETGRTVWKTARDEQPSWGSPTVIDGPDGPELVTNASKAIRGYDPRTGRELWRLGPTSDITAPTPFASGGLIVAASGRAPSKPLYVIRAGARGDLSLAEGQASSDAIAWSRVGQGRGPYMPTPVVYQGLLYVLANNAILDAYDLRTGEEVYRARVPQPGSGFSASPVAADGRLYLSSEDGEVVVVRAGRTFEVIAENTMGELLMATPALSRGRMFVRTQSSLWAIGR